MKLVDLESPFAGDIGLNLRYARRCMRDCILRGEAPIASHLLYTQEGILDDTNDIERKLGMSCGDLWAAHAELTVVYTDLGISKGMEAGIEDALKVGRPIEWRRFSKYAWPGVNYVWEVYEGLAETYQRMKVDAA